MLLKALGLAKPVEAPPTTTTEKAAHALQQALDFELTLRAMDYVLDDRADEGIALIKDKQDEQPIFKLGLGVVEFLEATLGFEPETMRKAFVTLQAAESMALRDRSKYQKLKIKTSLVYPPGTEFAVMYAEANLLLALVMLLSESVIESAKALYKLRKAYHTLEEISKASENTPQHPNSSTASFSSSASGVSFADLPFPLTESEMNDPKLAARVNQVFDMRRLRIQGAHIGNSPLADRLRSSLGSASRSAATSERPESPAEYDVESDQATVDEFIASGVNLCFGILQVVLLLIPPAIGMVLLVVGFKGNRLAGLRMLWKAADARNIHSGIALLGLLVFYDGPFQFTDLDFDVPELLPEVETQPPSMSLEGVVGLGQGVLEDNASGFYSLQSQEEAVAPCMTANSVPDFVHAPPTLLRPGMRLEQALLRARALFPNSALWLLQEGRMLASQGQLTQAVAIMSDPKEVSCIQMKQVEALLIYDRAMILLFLHEYERAAEDFLSLVEKNAWSHALYTYFAGCCYLEIYRMLKLGIYQLKSPEDLALSKVDALRKYRKLAETTIMEAPLVLGKKKFLAKTMPFDKFLLRKIESFEKTQKACKLSSIVDAIGVSPIHELKYFWNGYNRMSSKDLEISLKMLGYSGAPGTPFSLNDTPSAYPLAFPESRHDAVIRYTLQAIALRRLGHIRAGQSLMDEYVLPTFMTSPPAFTAPFKFTKQTHDPWLYPLALYERALFAWLIQGEAGLKEVLEWLHRAEVVGEGDYELSTRVSMKIKAAGDRLRG